MISAFKSPTIVRVINFSAVLTSQVGRNFLEGYFLFLRCI